MPYRYLEDIATADVAFVAWGTSMEEMFGAAWDATLNVMVADPRRMENSVCREINLTAEGIEMLLFDLIQELIYYKDAEQLLLFLSDQAISRDAGAYHLSARACGHSLNRFQDRLQVDVKAVTLHRFQVTQLAGGWMASVVLDI